MTIAIFASEHSVAICGRLEDGMALIMTTKKQHSESVVKTVCHGKHLKIFGIKSCKFSKMRVMINSDTVGSAMTASVN